MIEPFKQLQSTAAVLLRDNVDTDLIVRVERLFGAVPRDELGRYCFETLRYRADGSADPSFPLNDPSTQGALILLAGENFGCGSAREGAVWALAGMGFRCIIAPSFGDIFVNNCFANGVLPISLPKSRIAEWASSVQSAGGNSFTVDLTAQTVTGPGGNSERFAIPALRREALLEGLDDITLTLTRSADIAAYAKRDAVLRPWAYFAVGAKD